MIKRFMKAFVLYHLVIVLHIELFMQPYVHDSTLNATTEATLHIMFVTLFMQPLM